MGVRTGPREKLAARRASEYRAAQTIASGPLSKGFRVPHRREFLSGALAGVAALPAGSLASAAQPAKLPPAGKFPVKAISSDNGLEATRKAYEQMSAGADPLDAAIEGVAIVEADPNDITVGYGGLPNENGVVELDAAVMHGPTHQAGAVAALQNIKHPSRVANLVRTRSDHVLLVGAGALAFARAHGFVEENLLTERSRKIWLYWKETLSDKDDWLPPPPEGVDPEVLEHFKRHTGTIHLGAINAQGDLSCVTTTSGLAFKLPGRVGDSPIIGAGLYVDNEIGSCGSTGRGEANLQNLSSFAAVELMRAGRAPQEAGLEVLRRIVKHSPARLLDEKGRPQFDLKLYLLSKNGEHAGVGLWGPAQFAITDAGGTRHEDCRTLYQKEPKKPD